MVIIKKEEVKNITFCKGRNCSAVNGVDHSDGCIKEHDKSYERYDIPGFEGTREGLRKATQLNQ